MALAPDAIIRLEPGAVVLLAVPSALRDRERRPLVVALLAAFLLCYALTLDALVGSASMLS